MNDTQHTLVLGGCRSGKTSHAQALAESLSEDNRIYIATCVPYDDEMKKRVKDHQHERDETWKTIEEPENVADAITRYQDGAGVILLDCLTLWVTNHLLKYGETWPLTRQTQNLITAVNASSCPVIIVSNEVGAGIVPENKLARQFRDMAGDVNKTVAKGVANVRWMVAGIPVSVKKNNRNVSL